ncbi:hypothetical protein [Moraxella bovoculi]|nr:hypothetical protein [Moraxella bovoculi]
MMIWRSLPCWVRGVVIGLLLLVLAVALLAVLSHRPLPENV